jgi:hypothetical protein
MAQYKITRERFLDWYFSDSDEVKSFGYSCMNELINTGKIEKSVQGLIDECGYIPKYICEGEQDKEYNGVSPLDLELCPSQVELIN